MTREDETEHFIGLVLIIVLLVVAALYIIAPHPEEPQPYIAPNIVTIVSSELPECKTHVVTYPAENLGNGCVATTGIIVNLSYAMITYADVESPIVSIIEPIENKMVVEAYSCWNGSEIRTMTSRGSYYYVLTQRAVVSSKCDSSHKLQRVKTNIMDIDPNEYCEMPLDVTPRVTLPSNASWSD